MTKSGKSLNQVEESSIVPPINDSAGRRPIDKIKNQDKDSKSAVRFLSLIPGNKGVRKYGLKIFKDYVPEVDVNPTGSTPESLGNLAQDFIKSSNVAKGSMFAQGGMTPGEFSHSTNPLTVVDKSGNDTGMELTGGEGVFDKPAMYKIKTLLRGG